MRDNDLEVLRALTAARESRAELADLLDFYHDLFEVQFKVKEQLPEPPVRDEVGRQWRLEGGIPQLSFVQLGIVPEFFAALVERVGQVVCRHNPNWPQTEEEWTPNELVALAREIFETWDTLTARGTDEPGAPASAQSPTALVVGFALAPYLQRAAEVILPQLDLSEWSESHCPVCGGRPNLAILESSRGARQLMCSRCNSLWNYARVGCPFCGSREEQKFYPSEDGLYRLYVCPLCHRYLKTLDLRGVFRQVHLPVERLLTVGMDLAAQGQGYRA